MQNIPVQSDEDKITNVDLFSANTLRLRQNGSHFTDDIFKCIFLNENVRVSIKISLEFVIYVTRPQWIKQEQHSIRFHCKWSILLALLCLWSQHMIIMLQCCSVVLFPWQLECLSEQKVTLLVPSQSSKLKGCSGGYRKNNCSTVCLSSALENSTVFSTWPYWSGQCG